MPGLYNLLNTDRVLCKADISSKKRALQTLADVLAKSDPELKARKVFDQFCERERLGSTGLGHGIAIPHCRMDGLEEPIAALITLEEPIDFDAPDDCWPKLPSGLANTGPAIPFAKPAQRKKYWIYCALPRRRNDLQTHH